MLLVALLKLTNKRPFFLSSVDVCFLSFMDAYC